MKIAAVDAELHVFEERVKWTRLIRLAIRFEDRSHLRLRCSGDGDKLIVDRLPLETPFDMGEGGRTEIFDITERLDAALRGAESGDLLAIKDAGQLIGFALPRLGNEPFCLWVHDDEFYWGSETSLKNDDWLEGREQLIGGPLLPL